MSRELSDAEVISLVLGGETEKFQILLERYKGYIFSIVGRHVPYERVEEVAHEAAVQLYLSLANFKGDSPEELRGWLAKIAVRAAYAFWRERYKSREVSMDSLSEEQRRWIEGVMGEASQERFDELTQKEEASEVLNWALSKLPPKDRMVLELTALEGYSVREAADMLGWSVANVKVRSMRARRKLHKVLKEAMEG